MEPLDPNALDPDALPLVELGRGNPDDAADAHTAGDRRPTRIWWYVVPTAVIVVVGMIVGIVVFNRAASDSTRGAASARDAATRFVSAVNAGDADAAAGLACDSFVTGARAVARTGEQGVRFTVVDVRDQGADTATAVLSETLSVAGAKESSRQSLNVFRTKGRWLMCGLAS